MNTRKKVLTLAIACILIMACLLTGTLAYISSTSTPIVNELTTADTTVTHEEPSWDPEDDHPLVPGIEFAKDPTPTLKEGSIKSYVFMEVEVSDALYAILDGAEAGAFPTVNTSWQLLGTKAGETEGSTVYVYASTDEDTYTFGEDTQLAPDDIALDPLFEKIAIKGDATNAQLTDALVNGAAEIKVTTKSVQWEGFDTAAAAYNAVFGAPTTPNA